MRYGRAQHDRIYFSSGDVARLLGVPLYQIARWEARFKITSRKNRGGNRVYLEKEVQQFQRISEGLNEGKNTEEILEILKFEEKVDSASAADRSFSSTDDSVDSQKSETLQIEPKRKEPFSVRDRRRIAKGLQEVLNILKS